MSQHHGQNEPYGKPPITMQPMGMGMVGYSGNSNTVETILTNTPQPISYMLNNDPPGLECLADVNHLFVKQKVELLEILTGFETNNEYQIFDNSGREIFYAKEDTDCCTRNMCGPNRPFDMTIKDRHGIEVIHLYRPLACGSCCFPCCLQSIEIHSPPGSIIGRVEQEWTCLIPKFKIKDVAGNVVLRIEGPCCTMSCCGTDVQFQVLSVDGTVEVGRISKKWSGIVHEMYTDADNFGIQFPADLDIKMKAVLIGACMLIDFMYFETRPDNGRN